MIIVLCSWPDCLCFQPLQTFLGPHSYPPLIFFISLSSFLATPYLLFLLSVHHDSHLFDRILTVTLFSLSFPHHSYSHLVFLIFSTLLINIFPSFPHSITLFSISLSSSFLSFPQIFSLASFHSNFLHLILTRGQKFQQIHIFLSCSTFIFR